MEWIYVDAYRWSGSSWDMQMQNVTVTADEFGAYRIGGLLAGTYRVSFSDWNDGQYIAETYSGFQGVDPYNGGTNIEVPSGGATVSGIDAQLEVGSGVEGTVTGEGGVTLWGSYINAYRWSGSSWTWSGQFVAYGSSTYRIGGLVAGTYRVCFSPWDSQYISETYNGFSGIDSYDGGTDIEVPGGQATVSGIDASLKTYASVSGKVIEAANGQPVEGVRVYIYGTQRSAVTDSAGNYTISRVIPGTNALHANPDKSTGLLAAWHGGAIYAEQRMFPSGATTVLVSSGQALMGVNFSLERSARINGIVLGGNSPLRGARIKALNAEYEIVSQTFTDAHGRYNLSALLPGTYTLKAEAEGFANEWWDGVNLKADATSFTLGAGEVTVKHFGLSEGQRPAFVEVTSEPAGAEIYLDYWPTGEVTPAVIDLGEIGSVDARGNRLASHVITLKKAGIPQPSPRTLSPVEAETVSEHFDLTSEASGKVMVQSVPGGAEVFVDYADTAVGVTPLLIENLAPGSHTVLLRKTGYLQPRPVTVCVDRSTDIVFLPVDYPTVEMKLVRARAPERLWADVSSDPQGIEILVDYLPSGQVTDLLVDWMDPASHTGAGWQTASHTILLRPTDGTRLAPRLVSDDSSVTNAMRVILPALREGKYLVIDLSGGPDAANYPVRYLDAPPIGGWTDEYKTDKLVLRRILAGTFMMGSPENELGRDNGYPYGNETQYLETLTEDFYIGVFEVTQRQWERVMGNRPSYFNNAAHYAMRPVEQMSKNDIQWNEESFMRKLWAKTGLDTFNLPTDAQWEYACRAGTKAALNSGKNLTSAWDACPNMSEVGRYGHNGDSESSQDCAPSAGTAKVGAYLPNALGLYDLHGNVWELCWNGMRGGSWSSLARCCRSASNYYWNYDTSNDVGFRLSRTVYSETALMTLTVANGTGGGVYAVGTAVAVEPDTPSAGWLFGHWVVDPVDADLGPDFDPEQPQAVVRMPEYDVTLTISYIPDPNDLDGDGVPIDIELDLGRNPNDASDGGALATVFGVVLGEGNPLEGATVSLRGLSGYIYHSAMTDATGSYGFEGVIPGHYYVKLKFPPSKGQRATSKPL